MRKYLIGMLSIGFATCASATNITVQANHQTGVIVTPSALESRITNLPTAAQWATNPATANVMLNGKWLSNSGGDNGIRVGTGGQVAIGTTTVSSTMLRIKPDAAFDWITGLSRTSATGEMAIGNATGLGNYMYMLSPTGGYGFLIQTYDDSWLLGSDLGLGTTAPAEKLHVAGRVRIDTSPSDTNDAIRLQELTFATNGLVATNMADVTIAGWRLQQIGSFSYLTPLAQSSGIYDSSNNAVVYFTPVARQGVSTNSTVAFAFHDTLRVGGISGTNLAVYPALTNIPNQISASTNSCFQKTGGIITGPTTISNTLEVTGVQTNRGNLAMSGGNIALGTNWISGDGGAEGVFVDSSGRVGVGTNAPNTRFQAHRLITFDDAGFSTWIGTDAGVLNTNVVGNDNGKYNTGVGYRAMGSNTTGDHNTAVGYYAMENNVGGDNNTAFGEDALFENISGQGNTAVGTHCLQNSKADVNTAVGNLALYGCINGYWNTAIGESAGYNPFATGNVHVVNDTRITLLGALTDVNHNADPTAFDNSTAIGYNAKITKSNQIVLGSGVTETLLQGNVGINTNLPAAKLHVGGSALIEGVQTNMGLLVVTGATSLAASGGNVGIGIAAANSKLDVYGVKANSGTYANGVLTLADTSSQANNVGGCIQLVGKVTDAGSYATGASIETFKINSTSGDYKFGLKINVSPNSGGPVTAQTILDTGNTGFGTTNPAAKLHVGGGVLVEGVQTNNALCYVGTNRLVRVSGAVGPNIDTVSTLYIPQLGGTNYLTEGVFDTATGPNWTFANNGRVFNGPVLAYDTNKPACAIQLARDGGIYFRNTTNGVSSVPVTVLITQQGSLGIGTNIPAATLHVNGSAIVANAPTQNTEVVRWVDMTNNIATNACYGEVYLETAVRDYTEAGGYEMVTGLTAGVSSPCMAVTSNGMTNLVAGTFRVSLAASFGSSANNMDPEWHLFTNAVKCNNIGWTRTISSVATGVVAATGFIKIPAGTFISGRMDSSQNGTITWSEYNMNVELIRR